MQYLIKPPQPYFKNEIPLYTGPYNKKNAVPA